MTIRRGLSRLATDIKRSHPQTTEAINAIKKDLVSMRSFLSKQLESLRTSWSDMLKSFPSATSAVKYILKQSKYICEQLHTKWARFINRSNSLVTETLKCK